MSDKVVLSVGRKSLGLWHRSSDTRELAAIFLGGAAGSLLRVGLWETFAAGAPGWPWVTFAINISGSFALAYLATRLLEAQSPYPLALLGPGFCGTYTTFSTMQVEILEMLDHRRIGLAAGYASSSIAAGYLAIRVGMALARRAPVPA